MLAIPHRFWQAGFSRGSTAFWRSRFRSDQVILAFPGGCIRRMATTINPPRDPNTLSNYNNWVSTHITANLDILFDQQKVAGNVIHLLKSKTHSESREIIFDTRHLEIGDVKVDGEPAKWELLPALEPYGNGLKIELAKGVELNKSVEVGVRGPTYSKLQAALIMN